MKLLLLNPNFNYSSVVIPSLGLGFLATYIKKHTNWDVEVCEPVLQGLSEKEILDKVSGVNILGMACYTESRFFCFEFAQKTKRINPDCKIIIGGPHVDTLDIEILRHYPYIDMVVRSEGEETLLEIIKGLPLEEIKGLTFRLDGKIIRNPDRQLIQNIDNLEFDYEFYQPWIRNWKDNEVDDDLKELRHLPIITSRGCYFNCPFCSAPHHWQRRLRAVSPQRRALWLKELVERYNIGYFRFYDSLFINNQDDIIKFCEILEEMNLKINFRIDIRAGTPPYLLERLRKVGCKVVGFGIESGADNVLININKGITNNLVRKTIKDCKKLGFWLIGFFMVSLPSEKLKDIKKTLSLFRYFDFLNIQFFKVYPNTPFYYQLCQEGKINDEIWFNREYGYNDVSGNQLFFCSDLFSDAHFSYKEISLIISYANELINFRVNAYKLSEVIPKIIRFIFIKIIFSSEIILRLYSRLDTKKPIKKIKIFLKHFNICR